jgi:hypothetical protein
MHAHVDTPPVAAARLLAACRSPLGVSDPFSFHSLNGTGRNQNRATAGIDITVLPTKPSMQGKGEMIQHTPRRALVSGGCLIRHLLMPRYLI